jgi:signal transduction histidine kinase
MFETLRSRLMASYLLLIVALFVLFIGTLIATSSLRRVRSFQTAIELNAVARPVLAAISRATQGRTTNDVFVAQLNNIAVEANIRILWVERSNLTILHDSDKGWIGLEMPAETTPRQTTNIQESTHFYEAQSGQLWVFYVPPEGQIGRTYLIFAKMEPSTGAFLSGLLGQPLLRSLAISLLLAFVFAALIARSIAKPLQRIAGAANDIARGNYGESLPLEGPAEVRALAMSFNKMSQQVQVTQTAQRDFVANVSHDLKTPITSIQGWSQALLDGTADGEMVQASAEIIHTESARMSRMVNQLLELERLEAGQLSLRREPFRVRAWLESIVAPFLPRALEREIAVDIAADSVHELSADVDKLARAVGNLVDNAIRHTVRGGTVTLATNQELSTFYLTVSDTGKGIPDADKHRIFERFYQADRARTSQRTGTGLGLAITREIVEAHGGTVSVHDNQPVGAIFEIRLPV